MSSRSFLYPFWGWLLSLRGWPLTFLNLWWWTCFRWPLVGRWEPQQNSADRIHNFGEVIQKLDKEAIHSGLQNSSTTLPASERLPSRHRPAPSTTPRSWQRQRPTPPCKRTPSQSCAGAQTFISWSASRLQTDQFTPQRVRQLPYLLTRPCGRCACLQQGFNLTSHLITSNYYAISSPLSSPLLVIVCHKKSEASDWSKAFAIGWLVRMIRILRGLHGLSGRRA